MIYPVYSIRDAATGFMTPSVDMNDASAKRNFEHAVMNSASLMNSHPGDYVLYRIGQFDTETGVLLREDLPVHICDASSVVR